MEAPWTEPLFDLPGRCVVVALFVLFALFLVALLLSCGPALDPDPTWPDFDWRVR